MVLGLLSLLGIGGDERDRRPVAAWQRVSLSTSVLLLSLSMTWQIGLRCLYVRLLALPS